MFVGCLLKFPSSQNGLLPLHVGPAEYMCFAVQHDGSAKCLCLSVCQTHDLRLDITCDEGGGGGGAI